MSKTTVYEETANVIWKEMQKAKEDYLNKINELSGTWIYAKFNEEGAPSQSELSDPLGEFEVSLIVDTRQSVVFE
jgi:hypothetical protein